MKMKKIFVAFAATAVTASAFAAMSISTYAAEKTIEYNPTSAGSLATGNEGTDVRRNIYNTWGNDVTDIDGPNTAVVDHITVNFTVSGIGTDSVRTNEDGSEEQLVAYLCGDAGTNDCWKEGDNGFAPVNINGDGDYTATWTLSDPSGSIECLILQSNINFYAYLGEQGGTLENSGVVLTVNSITTGEEESQEETTTTEAEETATTTEAEAAATTTEAAAATTTAAAAATTTAAAAATTTAAGATTTAAAGATTTTASAGEASAQTGDAGVGVALAVLAVGAGVAFTVRKKD